LTFDTDRDATGTGEQIMILNMITPDDLDIRVRDAATSISFSHNNDDPTGIGAAAL